MVTGRDFTHAGEGTPAAAWREHPSWRTLRQVDLTGVDRVVVVAAHPDDESLGTGGLLATAARAGLATALVHATDGEGSHPGSTTVPPDDLASRRRQEARAAAQALGVQEPRRLGAPDGHLRDHEDELVLMLVDLLGDARHTVVVAPWREDGHPDHEAAGRAAAVAARRTGAQLWEFPVWFWHWGAPNHAPWDRISRFDLDDEARAAKSAAIAAHASQVQPLSDLPGDEVLLGPDLLAHFAGGSEHFLVSDPDLLPDDTLDRLHAQEEEPWGAESRWFERRKRELVLATLPRARFASALEVGCSTGVLAETLAERCDRLLAIDRSPAALEVARRRLASSPGAAVAELDLHREWPERRFDLVVVSEVGYFLSPAALDRLVLRLADSLTSDGVVVLCHWRHPIEGWVMGAEEVHAGFERDELPPLQATYRDRDVEIRVLAGDDSWPDPSL